MQYVWFKRNKAAVPAPAPGTPSELEVLKRELKDWEHNFIKAHGRKPTKEDVEKVPEIKRKYRKHANMQPKVEPKQNNKRKRDDRVTDNSDDEKEVDWVHRAPPPAVADVNLVTELYRPVGALKREEDYEVEEVEGVHRKLGAEAERSASEDEEEGDPATTLRQRAFELFRAPRITDPQQIGLVRSRSETSNIGAGSMSISRAHQAALPAKVLMTSSLPDDVLLSSSSEEAEPEAKKETVPTSVQAKKNALLAKPTAGGARARRANFVKLRLKNRGSGGGGGGARRKLAKKLPPARQLDEGVEKEDTSAAALSSSFILPDTENFAPLPPAPSNPPPPRASLSELSSISAADLEAALKRFGHPSFRPGQREATDRLVRGLSTLLVTPTGAGKSLAYQLPTLLYSLHAKTPALTLVISPLLALVTDQIRAMPSFLPCERLDSTLSEKQATAVRARISAGAVRILFISPERLATARFIEEAKSFPPIILACIDEAHCLSEWSHTFRSSYLRLPRVLSLFLAVPTVLALTATATQITARSICSLLSIPPEGVIRSTAAVPSHLSLAVSNPPNKMQALWELGKLSGPMQGWHTRPSLVYCSKQRECEDVAAFLQEQGVDCQPYHAGRLPHERARLEAAFLSDKVRVLCATVAFGMGIDKRNVRHVIHYTMPRSLEQYVQEVGRAGRDGESASCQLFLSPTDYYQLLSYAFEDGCDEVQVKRFVKSIIAIERAEVAPYYATLSVEKTEMACDLRKEVICTALDFLESSGLLSVLPEVDTSAEILFLRLDAEALAAVHPPIAACVACGKQRHNGTLVVDLAAASRRLAVSIPALLEALQRLRTDEYIKFTTSARALYVHVPCVPPVDKLDALIASCHAALTRVQRAKEFRMRALWATLKDAAVHPVHLHDTLNKYFAREADQADSAQEAAPQNLSFIRSDIRVFLSTNGDQISSARQVARIMQGLSSPAFPSRDWERHPFWRRHHEVDFAELLAIAQQELRAVLMPGGGEATHQQK